MTNADKTGSGCSFTCVEAARISQREDIVQVLKSKHVVSVEATPTVLILCALRWSVFFPSSWLNVAFVLVKVKR